MNGIKKFAVAAAAVLALTGCAGGAEVPEQPTSAPEAAAQTTAAPETTQATQEPVEATQEPVKATEEPEAAEYVEVPTTLEETPWGQMGLEHPWEMSKRQYRGMMKSIYKHHGKKEFCEAVNDSEGMPGENLVLGLIFTDIEIYWDDESQADSKATEKQMADMVKWSNDFFADKCDWHPASEGIENAQQEADANKGIAESFGPDQVAGWDKQAVLNTLDNADASTQQTVCDQLTDMNGGDWSLFYGPEYNTWSGEDQQQAMLWAVDWALANCDF